MCGTWQFTLASLFSSSCPDTPCSENLLGSSQAHLGFHGPPWLCWHAGVLTSLTSCYLLAPAESLGFLSVKWSQCLGTTGQDRGRKGSMHVLT